jgi:hypothetical protein
MATGSKNHSMASRQKRTGPASFASQRELIELAKTLDLAGIVKKTGRTPSNILNSAKRLGLSIKGGNVARSKVGG